MDGGGNMEKMIADEKAVSDMLDKLAREIVQKHPRVQQYCLVGIKTRGAYIAKRLRRRIEILSGQTPALGELDISFYRDDLTLVAPQPHLNSPYEGDVFDGKTVLLTDDVLYSGKTVLCALNALSAAGRANGVEFLTLVDRGHHRLPVCADLTGRFVPTAFEDIIHVHLKEKDGDDCIMHHVGGQKERK